MYYEKWKNNQKGFPSSPRWKMLRGNNKAPSPRPHHRGCAIVFDAHGRAVQNPKTCRPFRAQGNTIWCLLMFCCAQRGREPRAERWIVSTGIEKCWAQNKHLVMLRGRGKVGDTGEETTTRRSHAHESEDMILHKYVELVLLLYNSPILKNECFWGLGPSSFCSSAHWLPPLPVNRHQCQLRWGWGWAQRPIP